MFDREIFIQRRKLLAKLLKNSKDFEYIRDEIADQVVERIDFFSRKQIHKVVELGAANGYVLSKLPPEREIQEYIICDYSQENLEQINPQILKKCLWTISCFVWNILKLFRPKSYTNGCG